MALTLSSPLIIRNEMIELRRRMLGVSQKVLADRVNMSQGTLSKIEQGLKTVTQEQAEKFSEALSCPISFFTMSERLYGGPISAVPMYRKKASVGIKVLDRLIAEINVRIAHVRKLLQFIEFQPEFDLPSYDPDDYDGDAAEIAKNTRKSWYMPSGPVKNIVEVLERAGCLVIDCDMDDTGLSGVSYNLPGLPPMIFINKNQPLDRYRFTLAHELGHLIMHKAPNPDMEAQADTFAAEFLMPSRDISPYLRDMSIEKAASLKPFWRASMASIIFRAKTLGFLNQGQNEYIWRQMSSRGYRINEPVQLSRDGENPTLLAEIFEHVKQELEYDNDEISQVFSLNFDEIQKLYLINKSNTLRLVK
ncbi:ImmA/IrrE family metallo-endopeptidase [Serratia proteamaculans]|uniref:ImmA/IrrE family metallo-endopeptidase n=2 Tax=Serratia proteamaculans TaxID=28151 RepID=A0A5Q2V812_SERPR|nr:ImmA/IrrE family metallo-endopeptidase [Serratia proteamaculans]